MGQAYTSIFNSVNRFVLGRRESKYGANRSRPDHPEIIDSSQIPPARANESATTSTDVIPKTNVEVSAQQCSDFYLACRNNDVDAVKELLETLAQDEIDQLEPNGSTALHAAAFHGHVEIVRLLLDRGANRAVENKFGCLPFDETSSDEIKELFLRMPNNDRLKLNTGAIEWELIDDDALEKAMEERRVIETIYQTTPINRMFEKIQKSYVEKGLAGMSKIDMIKHFFEKATKEQNPKWIITAYTAETDFYNVLNGETAGGANKYMSERRYIIALLMHHPSLDSLTFIGTCYRVMQVNDHGIQRYQVNRLSMTKSFLSSSIDENISAWFISRYETSVEKSGPRTRHRTDGTQAKLWVLCKYQIKHKRTALHIESSSQYTAEGEVLIMPYTVFKIKNVSKVAKPYLPRGETITEIEFEECDEYTEE